MQSKLSSAEGFCNLLKLIIQWPLNPSDEISVIIMAFSSVNCLLLTDENHSYKCSKSIVGQIRYFWTLFIYVFADNILNLVLAITNSLRAKYFSKNGS